MRSKCHGWLIGADDADEVAIVVRPTAIAAIAGTSRRITREIVPVGTSAAPAPAVTELLL